MPNRGELQRLIAKRVCQFTVPACQTVLFVGSSGLRLTGRKPVWVGLVSNGTMGT